MAKQEHFEILKQGSKVWNEWREENPKLLPDLRDIDFEWPRYEPDLSGADLTGADLRGAALNMIRLDRAILGGAHLRGAYLSSTILTSADLSRADLREAKFPNTNLTGANLSEVNLRGTDFRGAILRKVNLSNADLIGAHFHGVDFRGANFTGAAMYMTVIGDSDLSETQGLDLVAHHGPSTIGVDTVFRSLGRIPELFLSAIGLPDHFLTYVQSLIETAEPIQFYTCFISYSSRDQTFAKQLYIDLQRRGIRCWYAPEDMKIGDKIRSRIDESIQIYDKLLLVLSDTSVSSQWVEQEVETALLKEREQGRAVLFPIRLDNSVMEVNTGWPALIKNTRHIGDFTNWGDHDAYQKAFDRLIRDLKAEESRSKRA